VTGPITSSSIPTERSSPPVQAWPAQRPTPSSASIPTARPDTTFGNAGVLATNFAGGNGTADALALGHDGSLLVAGQVTDASGTPRFAVARFGATTTGLSVGQCRAGR